MTEVLENIDIQLAKPRVTMQAAKNRPNGGVEATQWPIQPESVRFINGLEQNVLRGFAALDRVQIANPHIEALQEYGSNLEDKFAILRSDNPITKSLAELMLGEMSRENRKNGFSEVMLRIRKDTSYLQELEAENVVSGLINGLQDSPYGAHVFFIHDTLLGRVFAKSGILGGYNPHFDFVLMGQSPVPPEMMWQQLVSTGTLPQVVEALDHELVHDAQTGKMDRAILWAPIAARMGVSYFSAHILGVVGPMITRAATIEKLNPLMRKVNDLVKGDKTLHEVHAYEAAASSPTADEPDMDEEPEIVTHVVTNYEEKGMPMRERVIKAFAAYDEVHSLRLLGLDDRQIGHLVGRARYDAKTNTYPHLSDAIAQQLKEWGLPASEDEPASKHVLTALKARRELEFHVQRQKARDIAANELKKESGIVNIN